ncbi:MAG: DUF1801 domain-containing protein [Saprospiraceae bacterium]
MQSVSFRNFEECFDFLPEDQQKVVEVLRDLILETIPNVKEKLAYNVPYYSVFKNICFIWPGAVPWGKVTVEGVNFGFTSGHLLSDDHHYMEAGTRKYVTMRKFLKPSDIDVEILTSLLVEAAIIDQGR